MDFQTLLADLQKIEVVKHNPPKSEIIEDCSGYYVLPCSKEPFKGEVISLSGDEFYVIFQRFSEETEHLFRNRLERMDQWFFDKPHRVQVRWIEYIPKWLSKTNADEV